MGKKQQEKPPNRLAIIMSSIATGSKVVLFALLEFTSMEQCEKSREILLPVSHHGLIYECEWDLQSQVFYYQHSQIHAHFLEIPPSRPYIIEYKTNAR